MFFVGQYPAIFRHPITHLFGRNDPQNEVFCRLGDFGGGEQFREESFLAKSVEKVVDVVVLVLDGLDVDHSCPIRIHLFVFDQSGNARKVEIPQLDLNTDVGDPVLFSVDRILERTDFAIHRLDQDVVRLEIVVSEPGVPQMDRRQRTRELKLLARIRSGKKTVELQVRNWR